MTRASQIKLVQAIANSLTKQGHDALNARQLNAVIRAADAVVAALDEPHRPAVPGMGLAAWLACDETGLSSLAMAWHLAPLADRPAILRRLRQADRTAHPIDPADLGRCLGLLAAAPELRPHLTAMGDVCPAWAALVGAWEELEALYREEAPGGSAPRLYARMRELLDGAEIGERP